MLKLAMLTLCTTEDFSAWFQALGDADAEDVATGLELIERLGPERTHPDSSELLLWYECRPVERRFDAYFFRFREEVQRMRAHLESAPMRARLRDASDERVRDVASALAQLRESSRRWRHSWPKAHTRALERDVRGPYLQILRALGEPEPAAPTVAPVLREWCGGARSCGWRVLYGIDAAHKRGLVVLGEALDRQVYGPAVRKALAVWRQFLMNEGDVALRPLPTGSTP